MDVAESPRVKSDTAALNGRELWPSRINSQEPGLFSKVHYQILPWKSYSRDSICRLLVPLQ